jgi:8-oxo-dGTP pyrophosphatase MutT (NUDIX family)
VGHVAPFRHGVCLILFNDQSELLLQHRSHDALHYPGHWSFFVGAVQAGVSPRQAVRREIVEELEYNCNPTLFLIRNVHVANGDVVFQNAFYAKYDGKPLRLNEGQGMDWFSFEQIKYLKMADFNKSLAERFERFLSTAPIDLAGSH